jgi:hypothetical protein
MPAAQSQPGKYRDMIVRIDGYLREGNAILRGMFGRMMNPWATCGNTDG